MRLGVRRINRSISLSTAGSNVSCGVGEINGLRNAYNACAGLTDVIAEHISSSSNSAFPINEPRVELIISALFLTALSSRMHGMSQNHILVSIVSRPRSGTSDSRQIQLIRLLDLISESTFESKNNNSSNIIRTSIISQHKMAGLTRDGAEYDLQNDLRAKPTLTLARAYEVLKNGLPEVE